MKPDEKTNFAARIVVHSYGYIPPLGFKPSARDGGIERYALQLLASDGGKALDGRGGAQEAAALLRSLRDD